MAGPGCIVHRLPVGGGHVMHVEEHGNPAGLPALVLHGGPGSGGSPLQRACLDPARHRILCPDQRGAGQSTPRGSIEANTTADLLADLRLLRAHLGVPRWLVAGGSWGATLALLHALDAPGAVAALVLRNPFLARAQDIEAFIAAAGLPAADVLADVFANGSPAEQRGAAACWWAAEQRLAGARVATAPDGPTLDRLVDRYRVQSHYLARACWLQPDLLQRCAAWSGPPVILLQGTEDRVCPAAGAQALLAALGGRADLRLVSGAGHDPAHPAMAQAMRQAVDEMTLRLGAR